MANKAEVAKMLLSLKAAIPRFAPDIGNALVLEAWTVSLKDTPPEVLGAVFERLIQTRDEFPSLAEVLRALGECESGEAGAAFDKLLALIARHGVYRPPETDDIMARAINRLGGWQRVCSWLEEELHFHRREFESVYAELAAAKARGLYRHDELPRLVGLHESARSVRQGAAELPPAATGVVDGRGPGAPVSATTKAKLSAMVAHLKAGTLKVGTR